MRNITLIVAALAVVVILTGCGHNAIQYGDGVGFDVGINPEMEYYNHERPHSALDGRMIKPRPQDADGEIVEFSRLGGLLKSYRRVKMAA